MFELNFDGSVNGNLGLNGSSVPAWLCFGFMYVSFSDLVDGGIIGLLEWLLGNSCFSC